MQVNWQELFLSTSQSRADYCRLNFLEDVRRGENCEPGDEFNLPEISLARLGSLTLFSRARLRRQASPVKSVDSDGFLNSQGVFKNPKFQSVAKYYPGCHMMLYVTVIGVPCVPVLKRRSLKSTCQELLYRNKLTLTSATTPKQFSQTL
jgi:hypothetical protein